MNVHVLAIGIDAYKHAPLRFCVRDATRVRRLFQDTAARLVMLGNHEATLAGIVDSANDLARNAQPGDAIVVHFSGHGTRWKTDEGAFEAWVPIDYESAGYLTDREIGRGIDTTTPPGSQVVIFADCCHSGDSTREFNPTVYLGSRRTEADENAIRETYEERHPQAFPRLAPREGTARETRYHDSPEALFAACRPSETALESSAIRGGFFTDAYIAAFQRFRQIDYHPTNEEFLAEVLRQSKANPGRQRHGLYASDAVRFAKIGLAPTGRGLEVCPHCGRPFDEASE